MQIYCIGWVLTRLELKARKILSLRVILQGPCGHPSYHCAEK